MFDFNSMQASGALGSHGGGDGGGQDRAGTIGNLFGVRISDTKGLFGGQLDTGNFWNSNVVGGSFLAKAQPNLWAKIAGDIYQQMKDAGGKDWEALSQGGSGLIAPLDTPAVASAGGESHDLA